MRDACMKRDGAAQKRKAPEGAFLFNAAKAVLTLPLLQRHDDSAVFP
jgi:hypothetical protein